MPQCLGKSKPWGILHLCQCLISVNIKKLMWQYTYYTWYGIKALMIKKNIQKDKWVWSTNAGTLASMDEIVLVLLCNVWFFHHVHCMMVMNDAIGKWYCAYHAYLVPCIYIRNYCCILHQSHRLLCPWGIYDRNKMLGSNFQL